MTYILTGEQLIEQTLSLVKLYGVSDITDKERTEIRQALERIPEIVNPYRPIRGNPVFWSSFDLQELSFVLEPSISYYIIDKRYKKTMRNDPIDLIVDGKNNEHKILKSKYGIGELDPTKVPLDVLIYLDLTYLVRRTRYDYVADIFNKYIAERDYGYDTKQQFYDMVELRYTNTTDVGQFGHYINEFPILLAVSNLLYNSNSPYYRLGKDLNSLQINWRMIPKIKNLNIKLYERDIKVKTYDQTTIDQFLIWIQDYINEEYTKKYDLGSTGVKELIDESELKAGILSQQCASFTYSELMNKILQLMPALSIPIYVI